MNKDPTRVLLYVAIVFIILWRALRAYKGEFN